jgi:tetratricopeptide (TPR) repeat protein
MSFPNFTFWWHLLASGAKRSLAGWAGAAAKLAATILIVPTIVLLFGSFQSVQGQKEDSWRGQLRESWQTSPGALLLLAALEDKQQQKVDIAARVQNGKLLYEMGKYDEAEAVLVAVMREDPANRSAAYYLDVIKEARLWGRTNQFQVVHYPNVVTTEQKVDIPSRVQNAKLLYEMGKYDEAEVILLQVVKDDPSNRSAAYYLDLIKEVRYMERARRREEGVKSPPLPIRFKTNQVYITKGRQYILSKLESIMLDEVNFDLPLMEVLARLQIESQKRDPGGIGIIFMIDPRGDAGVGAPPAIDPGQVRIKISPPLRNLRLADVLDAITKAAESPIRYTVENYAVVFSPKPPKSNAGLTLYSKTFHVDPKTFLQGLQNVTSLTLNFDPQISSDYVARTNSTVAAHQLAVAYFAACGVNLEPPKLVFFNDRFGELMVRATQQDLDIIQQAVALLNQTPPQVLIEARFVEVDEASLQGLALDWNKPAQNISGIKTDPQFRAALGATGQEFTGIMSDKQFRSTLAAIEQRFHADVLLVPKVTTESGREARVSSLTGDEGVTLDVLAVVGPDGYFIQTTAIPTIKTGHQTWQARASR